MPTLVSLAEAASFLGISKATLRNWDREGKLKAHRHPINRYRAYDLNELRALRLQVALFDDTEMNTASTDVARPLDTRAVKRLVARLHGILRDTDGDSSIIQRFDELTKLLFLRLAPDETRANTLAKDATESAPEYAARLRRVYEKYAAKYSRAIPQAFASLRASDQAINQCGTALATVPFGLSSFDIKGVAYEEVIQGTFDKSDHQQFFTPHQIVSLMTAMLEPYIGGVVMDPACGTAGFLAAVSRQSDRRYKRLVGLEIDERLAWVAGINLILHGVSDFDAICLDGGGTLGPKAQKFFGQVNCIITNPPFGSDFSDQSALQSFELGAGRISRRRGILFIERCWDLLADQGVLGIVIDEGVLSLPSSIDVRRFILDRFDILAVVGLPESAFMPYASVNTSILVMRKTKKRHKSKCVFFAKAERIGRKGNGDDDVYYDERGNAILNSDLPAITSRWRELHNGNKIESTNTAFVTDVSAALAGDTNLRLDFQYHHPARHRSRAQLEKTKYPLLSLVDICEERNEIVVPSKELADQVILYTGLANIEPGSGRAQQVPTPAAAIKSAVKKYLPNDIVFARMRPTLRKVALMSFEEGGYVSPECSVLSVRQDSRGEPIIAPELLASILRSDLVFGQVAHLVAGIGRPRLNVTDLRSIRLPLPPIEAQLNAKAELDGHRSAAARLRSKAAALIQEAEALESNAVDELATRIING